MADDGIISVGLTVREWLSRIDAKLDTKADKSDITELRSELTIQSRRIDNLESSRLREEGARQERDKSYKNTAAHWQLRASLFGVIVMSMLGVVDLVLRLFSRT